MTIFVISTAVEKLWKYGDCKALPTTYWVAGMTRDIFP
jgi:hypothetical protein